MLSKKFQRQVEDFICENCKQSVIGNGYTNHCPKCLWSKHVDVNPGDRQAVCQGLMKPIDLETKAGEQVLIHHCLKCGFARKNKVVKTDEVEALIKLSADKF